MAGAASPRVQIVDLLRGAALFGILCVNVWFFVGTGVGGPAQALTQFLFTAKSYLLFAFLFGYSFHLQERTASAVGTQFVPMMRRRLVGLLVIGLIHGIFVFPGDILVPYALLGFALLQLSVLSVRSAVRWAVGLTAGGGAMLMLLGGIAWSSAASPTDHAQLFGTAGQVFQAHAVEYVPTLVTVLLVQGAPALGAMLAGLAAARLDLFGRPDVRRAACARFTPWGPVVGVLGSAFLVWALAAGGSGVELFALGVVTLTAPFFTGTYVALLTRLRDGRTARAVAAAGRLSLTNYLAQSIALNLIFTGVGLSLGDEVTGWQVLAIVVVVYAVSVVVSDWWVRTHRYGPAEWLLRRWTYGAPDVAARPV